MCARVSSVRPGSGRCWPARQKRGGEGEWKSQLKERSLVCLLECLWEPLTVNLSCWRVRKRERNEGEDTEEKPAREIRRFDFNGPSVLEWSWLICLSFFWVLQGLAFCQAIVVWGTCAGIIEATQMSDIACVCCWGKRVLARLAVFRFYCGSILTWSWSQK